MAKARAVLAIVAVACATALPGVSRAALTFNVSGSGSWPSGAQWTAVVNSMQAVVNCYNAYGVFGGYNIYAYYNSGIPTAQASYLGSIGFGGTYPNQRVAQHESNHYLGSGTTQAWENMMAGGYWHGAKMNALAAQFDGDGTIIHGDTAHFWPYGLNYDSEVVNSSVFLRNIAILYAERQDDGLGNQADPWSATTVTLTQSDAAGDSAFNWYGAWNDGYFAHSGAAYSTGNYAIRTPLDTYNPAGTTPSFTFAGDSLTLNNSGSPSAGLYFKGVGAAGILTFKNLILDGGSTHHFSSASDVFQLAGKVTVASGGTINSEQGATNILAAVTGSGNLTIGVTNGFLVTLLSPSNTFTGNINVAGRLQLASGANQDFVIGANGVNNAITGPSAQQVSLNGVFNIDLTNASTHAGDFWTLVSAANAAYGSTFGINGFTYAGGLWRNTNGYAYSQSNGQLTSLGARPRRPGLAQRRPIGLRAVIGARRRPATTIHFCSPRRDPPART